MNGERQGAREFRCAACGRLYVCDPQGACWCKELSLRLPLPVSPDAECLCPCKLEALTQASKKDA
ncbi:MAG TPA: hypothetical protein VMU42_06125 [Candidatus Sulfotelmatobacter sp.]|nr:hypothetical protein [Candidatus Sulfotelmatobacter sp.]